MANKSCNTSATTQHFIIVPKLHVLGANISGNTFNTVDTTQKEIESIKHGIFTNIVLHVNTDPKVDAFNTQDSLSTVVSGDENNWQKANSAFSSEMTYINTTKSILYNEYSYISKQILPQTMANGFYDIPSDNILDFGVIYNKNTHAYEFCLIDEGNEKCNLTLEARLLTYWDGSGSYIRSSDDADNRLYPHNLIGNTFTIPAGKQVSDFATYAPDDTLSGSDNIVNTWDSHNLLDLNPHMLDAVYYNNLIFNFFLCGTKIVPSNPIYEHGTYPYDYSAENAFYSFSDFPGENQYFWQQSPNYIRSRNSSGSNNIQYFRYYTPAMGFITANLQPTPENVNHEYNFRYTGSILSNPNAYSSMLGHRADGKVVRMPEVRTDLNGASVSLCTDNPHSMSKQTGRYSYKNVNGTLKPRVPLKSGVSNKLFNDNNIPDAPEGYLSDRDSILVSKGIGPEYSLNSHHWGLIYLWSGGSLYGLKSYSAPREVEFELFYCSNINNPFASQNLFNFGRKLNKLTSGFNTGILKESVANKLTYNYSNPNENDFVHIQELKDYTNSSLIYGCEWEMLNTGQNVTRIQNLLNGSTSWWANQPACTNVIPTVDVNGVWIWENCGVPKFGSKKLIGKRDTATGHYTYGKYFLAYFAHNLYLIDDITFNTYFYTAQEFKEHIDTMIDPNDTGFAANADEGHSASAGPITFNNCIDPFNISNILPIGIKGSSYSKYGSED